MWYWNRNLWKYNEEREAGLITHRWDRKGFLKEISLYLSLKVHLSLEVQVHIRPVRREGILVEKTVCSEELLIAEFSGNCTFMFHEWATGTKAGATELACGSDCVGSNWKSPLVER